MDLCRLAILSDLSCYHKVGCVENNVAAFLLAMCNIVRKFTRFIYVDRIVVSSAFRGLHLGTGLYEDLFRCARQHGIPLVTCEYNIVPPNESSQEVWFQGTGDSAGCQWH